MQSRGFLAPTHAKHVLLGCFATTGPLRVPSPTDHGALTRFARAIPWLTCSNTCKACVAWLLRNHGSASRPESYGPRGPHSLRSDIDFFEIDTLPSHLFKPGAGLALAGTDIIFREFSIFVYELTKGKLTLYITINYI